MLQCNIAYMQCSKFDVKGEIFDGVRGPFARLCGYQPPGRQASPARVNLS
jgi:hypothetical protein